MTTIQKVTEEDLIWETEEEDSLIRTQSMNAMKVFSEKVVEADFPLNEEEEACPESLTSWAVVVEDSTPQTKVLPQAKGEISQQSDKAQKELILTNKEKVYWIE